MKEEIRIKEWEGTCSIENPKERHVTFARTVDHLWKLNDISFRIGVFAPKGINRTNIWDNIIIHESEFFEYEFAMFHNEFYKDKEPDANKYNAVEGYFGNPPDGVIEYELGEKMMIFKNLILRPETLRFSMVDPTVVIAEGLHISIGPEGKRVQLKHMGNVVFEPDCRVGPLTFIQRATLPGCSTIIKKGALVDGYCTIGHNAVIGENSLVAAGSVIGAGTVVGKNCLLGIHTITKPHVKICDRVVVGISSVVIKDLDRPGIYFGNPAVFKKEHPENWMW